MSKSKYYYFVSTPSEVKKIVEDGISNSSDGIIVSDLRTFSALLAYLNLQNPSDYALYKISEKGIKSFNSLKLNSFDPEVVRHLFVLNQANIEGKYISHLNNFHNHSNYKDCILYLHN